MFPRRQTIPFLATLSVLVLLYGLASLRYDGFFSSRVIANLFSDNAFLGIAAVGMTFVILSGGIDLSVGSVMGFTTILIASLVGAHGWHPAPAILLALGVGTALGLGMGGLIRAYRMPPFLVTLAGMFLVRGLSFVVRMESLAIQHPFYDRLLDWQVPVGGKGYVSATALIFLATLAVGMYLAHFTRFGRTVYAVGGSETSAVLMGLPVGRTKVLVYGWSGFCAALAGVVGTLYMGSGNPAAGIGLELDVIACVVIGGTLLTGGRGYVAGTLAGVLIFGTIQSALNFDGRLNSWWLRIAVGSLLLLFMLLQRALIQRHRLAT